MSTPHTGVLDKASPQTNPDAIREGQRVQPHCLQVPQNQQRVREPRSRRMMRVTAPRRTRRRCQMSQPYPPSRHQRRDRGCGSRGQARRQQPHRPVPQKIRRQWARNPWVLRAITSPLLRRQRRGRGHGNRRRVSRHQSHRPAPQQNRRPGYRKPWTLRMTTRPHPRDPGHGSLSRVRRQQPHRPGPRKNRRRRDRSPHNLARVNVRPIPHSHHWMTSVQKHRQRSHRSRRPSERGLTRRRMKICLRTMCRCRN